MKPAVLMVTNQKKTSPVHASDSDQGIERPVKKPWLLQWLFSLNLCAAGS
jgi:hypothetical protein